MEVAAQRAESDKRIVVADHARHARSALRLLLDQLPGIGPIIEVANAADCLATLAQAPADVLLLEWRLPGLGAEQLLSRLRTDHPGLAIVALSSRPEDASEALAAGADLFVSKCEPPEALLAYLV